MSRADRAPPRRALVAPTLLALAAIALLLYLGTWQLARDAERNRDWRATQEDSERPTLRSSDLAGPDERVMWRRVHATVVFSDAPMLLSGASEDHRPGFRVMQMGTLEGAEHVLVDRGFLAHEGVEDAVNAFAPDGQQVVLSGRVRPLADSRTRPPTPGGEGARRSGLPTPEPRWPPRAGTSTPGRRSSTMTGRASITPCSGSGWPRWSSQAGPSGCGESSDNGSRGPLSQHRHSSVWHAI